MVIEGDSLDNIRTCYIVIDTVRYQFTSTCEAFDILFKLYFTFNIQYPKQSAHLLQLIQNGVYNIKTKFDVVYPENLDILKLFKDNEV